MAEPTGQLNDSTTFGTGLSEYYNKQLNKTTTASFVRVLQINMRGLRDSAIVIHNNAAGDLDYQILGTVEKTADIADPTGTDDDNKGWVVIAAASIATTNLPDDLALGLMMGTKNNTTTAAIMWVDYVKAISSRSFGSSSTK